jgi:hypothetical protein
MVITFWAKRNAVAPSKTRWFLVWAVAAVPLACGGESINATNAGQIEFNQCPKISRAIAVPLQAPVGESILLSVSVSDESNESDLYAAWNDGSTIFGDDFEANYRCSSAGRKPLTVYVSDTSCIVSETIEIECLQAIRGRNAGPDLSPQSQQ